MKFVFKKINIEVVIMVPGRLDMQNSIGMKVLELSVFLEYGKHGTVGLLYI